MATIATLSPTDLTVAPGASAATTIRVRNTGSVVDRYDIDVVGVAGWVRVDPPSLSLFPGAEGSASITFAPPMASIPRAGTYPFGVRVRPDANPGESTVEEGRITVEPFTAVSADIAPRTSRGSRAGHHEVAVENRGNAPAEVVVGAVDPDRRLSLAVDPPRAVVGPDEAVGFTVRVRVDDPFLFGATRPRPFVANVEAGRQAPIQLPATLSQQGILPAWVPRIGIIALALVAAAGGAMLFGLGPFARPGASEPPVGQVVQQPTEPPTPTPTQAPAEVPSEAAEPPSEEVPSPPPPLSLDELALEVAGDNGEFADILQLKCGVDAPGCRDDVKDVVLAMVTGLRNEYTGVGITSTRSTAVPNAIPVVLSAERDIPWRQVENGQDGVTRKAVVDLGPLLASPPGYAYAVVNTSDGIPHRFVVDSGLAQQLFDMLYQLNPAMPPVEVVTLPPDLSVFQPVDFQGIWQLDPNLIPLVTPAP